jgi:hypothetical protein
MDIPIHPADAADLGNIFTAWEKLLTESLGQRWKGSLTSSAPRASAPGNKNRPGVFGLMHLKTTLQVADPQGRKAEVEIAWEDRTWQTLRIGVQAWSPGYEGVGCAAALVVSGLWIVAIVCYFSWIISLRGRALGIVVIGGMVAWVLTGAGAAIAISSLSQSLWKLLHAGRWRASEQFARDEVLPCVRAAVETAYRADGREPPP